MTSDQQPLHKKSEGQGSGLPPEPLPQRKKCGSYHVFKILCIIYAIFFILIGVLLTCLAVWILMLRKDFQSLNDSVLLPAILLLIVGLVILLTALLGCIGSACDKLWPLRIFLAVVILVFVLQVIIGVLAYVYRQESVEKFGDRISFAIEEYTENDDVMKAVDRVQRYWKCCGLTRPDDWEGNREFQCGNTQARMPCGVPDSCCVHETEGCGERLRSVASSSNISKRGCKESFQASVEKNLDVIGAVALAMAIIHILGIFVVYMYITKVEDRIRLFKYRKRFYN